METISTGHAVEKINRRAPRRIRQAKLDNLGKTIRGESSQIQRANLRRGKAGVDPNDQKSLTQQEREILFELTVVEGLHRGRLTSPGGLVATAEWLSAALPYGKIREGVELTCTIRRRANTKKKRGFSARTATTQAENGQ